MAKSSSGTGRKGPITSSDITIANNLISSQRFIDEAIVEEKIQQIEGQQSVSLPVLPLEIDGENFYILTDGHHTLAAANALDIPVTYHTVSRNSLGFGQELSSADILDALWVDDNWYYVKNGRSAF